MSHSKCNQALVGFGNVDHIIKGLMILLRVWQNIGDHGAKNQRSHLNTNAWCGSWQELFNSFCLLNLSHRTSRTIKGDTNSGLGRSSAHFIIYKQRIIPTTNCQLKLFLICLWQRGTSVFFAEVQGLYKIRPLPTTEVVYIAYPFVLNSHLLPSDIPEHAATALKHTFTQAPSLPTQIHSILWEIWH
jgi:hypothetical protein